MRIEKETLFHEEYVINIGSHRIPLRAISSFGMVVGLAVFVVWLIGYGAQVGSEIMAGVAYVSANGIYNPETHSYFKCEPVYDPTAMLKYKFACKNTTLEYKNDNIINKLEYNKSLG